MKLFNRGNEFKVREKALRDLKKTIETGRFDKDSMITTMFMWQSCIQQEVDLFKQCAELLAQIAQDQEEE